MKAPSPHGYGFISYRRKDSDALATLQENRLKAALPGWTFFLDFGSIPPGADFKTIIGAGLEKADLLLVLIQKDWLGQREAGQPARIFDDNDVVRYEVATALKRSIRILPVLVNDAAMPRAGELPADIAALSSINAPGLRIARFEADFANLVEAISGAPARVHKTSILAPLLGAVLGAAVAAVIGVAAMIADYKMTGQAFHLRVGGIEAVVLFTCWVAAGALLGAKTRAGRR